MKINSKDSIPSAPPAPSSTPSAGNRPIQDRSSTNLSSAVQAAIQQTSDTRVARVQEIAAAVRGGTYKPDAEAIADAILDDAEIDAKLQANS